MLTKEQNTQINKNPYENREGLVYVRVSSKKQEIEGHGRESQEKRCKQELSTLGVAYGKTFSDTYSGGGDFMKRPAMSGLLAYIDAHPYKKFIVIFDDLKRFARDTEFHIKLKSAFKFRDVVLKCLNHNFDESPEGHYVETILAAGNELERHQNRRQVIQKMKARLEAGYWAFTRSKGYKIIKDPAHGKISIPHEVEAPLLKTALEGFASGVFVRRIDACKYLVEKGFWKGKSPVRYTDKFTNMLRDPFYVGFIEYPKWEVTRRDGKHEGIISLETFERNIKRLGGEIAGKRIRVDLSPDFPLRGLLVCDFCEKHLTGAKSKRKLYSYYLCQNKDCKNYGKSIRKNDVEEQFIKLLKQNTLKPQVGKLIEVVFDRVWKEEVRTFEMRKFSQMTYKSSLDEKAKKLTNLIISSKSPNLVKTYETQLEELASEIKQVEDGFVENMDFEIPYRTALEKAVGLLKSPYLAWKNLGLQEQHQLFYFIFEEKLRYNQKTGYRTNEKPTAIRLFEEFATQNTLDVVLF